jgi:hypothetical protein
MRSPDPRQAEKGTIMVLVMTVLAALLAGGAVALYIQVTATRATSAANQARTSLYCAEAGLQAARLLILNNYTTWEAVLSEDCTPNGDCPDWYTPPAGLTVPGYYARLDGEPIVLPESPPDYRVTIYDNDDEFDGNMPNPNRDNDLAVFVRSDCLRYPSQPRAVAELVDFRAVINCVQNEQGGGCPANAGNEGQVAVPSGGAAL